MQWLYTGKHIDSYLHPIMALGVCFKWYILCIQIFFTLTSFWTRYVATSTGAVRIAHSLQIEDTQFT